MLNCDWFDEIKHSLTRFTMSDLPDGWASRISSTTGILESAILVYIILNLP